MDHYNPNSSHAPSSSISARHRNVRIPDEENTVINFELDERSPLRADDTSPGHMSGFNGDRSRSVKRLSRRLEENTEKFWDKFTRRGKRKIGVLDSLQALLFASSLNIFLVFIPCSWISHFQHWDERATFALSFFAIMPLSRLFEYGGEQMSFYLGKDLGDLVVITLSNAVEATLAMILLLKCELVLLKSTIAGVIILHLLLVPGVAFVAGGAHVMQQELHPHLSQLNHSMLTLGVLSLLLPATFFNSLQSSFVQPGREATNIVTDEVRDKLLGLSRGLAILLLIIYICSRVYLHNPPGEEDELHQAPNAPEALKAKVERMKLEEPEMNQYVCIVMLLVSLALMAATVEWLVESIEFIREDDNISEIWFGFILLPLVSFAADGVVATIYYVRHLLRHYFKEPVAHATLAKADQIDLSIQFALFWMPFLTLLAWWTGRPLTLLFDMWEVAMLIGATFLVNYVTADAKTNWAEGAAMVIFYLMIAVCTWYYTGQPELPFLSQCDSVAWALANLDTEGGHHGAAAAAGGAHDALATAAHTLVTAAATATAAAIDAASGHH